MIVIKNQAHLPQLGISAGFTLALPDMACRNSKRLPYVLCLHDYGQNGERLLQTLACAPLVDEAKAALLLPNGQNGCFLNMAHGLMWETYLLEGLLPYAARTFALQDPPKLYGVGTGGWAAARLAAAYPKRFAASAAVNAIPNLPKMYADGKLSAMPDLEAAFGSGQAVPDYPLCEQTLWFHGAAVTDALQTLLNEDWSTPA
ncbi:MAG TPA: hypothetical protein PK537_00580 [Candidatus Limiplasma sp.]|nr:hypothetical protein [Candidatus Limiplasma sp.]